MAASRHPLRRLPCLLLLLAALGRAGAAPAPAPATPEPQQLHGYALLGDGACADDLWRPVSSLCAALSSSAQGDYARACADLCSRAAAGMSRCMGMEVGPGSRCCLLDRDWDASEVSTASTLLGVQLDAQGLQEFSPGVHLVRIQDPGSGQAGLLGKQCYRRSVNCSGAPDCSALGRYACERGKVANTCDICLPRRRPSQRACTDADNQAVDAIGATCRNYTADDCRRHDDGDFNSSAVCCSCGGGARLVAGVQCRDLDGDARDSLGRPCSAYAVAWCGLYDTTEFRSSAMCCLCGGGSTPGNSPCIDDGAPVPTLRIAYAASTLVTDGHDENEGLQACYLGVAYAVKHAWDTAADIIPIPHAEREKFNIEFIGFSENYDKLTDRASGGTQEADPVSILTGLMAMSGPFDPVVQRRLQLRQSSPPGRPAHAVIGSKTRLDAEIALANAAGIRQTPILGFHWEDPGLDNRPFYLRVNRVALEPGRAVAKMFQQFGYTLIFVFEQVQQPSLANQIRAAHENATVRTEGPSDKANRGACDAAACALDIMKAWGRLREQDARVIAHEHGGADIEQVFALTAGLLGPKTLYVKTGHPCLLLQLFDVVAEAQAKFQVLRLLGQVAETAGAPCEVCHNLAFDYLDDPDLENRNATVAWLYSPERTPAHTQACPQFPTPASLLGCAYCNTRQSFFASPGCANLARNFDLAFERAMCVGADDSSDSVMMDAWWHYFSTMGVPYADDDVGSGLEASRLLRAAGMPESYLQPFEPGGRLWELGLQSSEGRPASWWAYWEDEDLIVSMGKNSFGDNDCFSMADPLLAIVVAYNTFLRYGGDADPFSEAWQPWIKNNAAHGFWQVLLGLNFTGFTGHMEFLPTGDRNVFYNAYQLLAGSESGCFMDLHFDTANASTPALAAIQRIRFVGASWNFVYADDRTNMSAEVVVVQENLVGCDPFGEFTLTGKVVFIKRGVCLFSTKALNAANAGAIATILWNPRSTAPMYMEGKDMMLRIPTFSVGNTDGSILYNNMAMGLRTDVKILGSARCVDPMFFPTGGQRFSEKTMVFNPRTGALTFSAPSLRFNGGGSHPPLQAPLSCRAGGSYNATLRECVLCRPGKSANQGLCLTCPMGRFVGEFGSTACTACGPGRVSLPDGTACAPCPRGSNPDSAGACAPCGRGLFWNESGCRPCAPGSAQSLEGSTACRRCEAGRYANEWESTTCNGCLPGNHQPEEGSTTCLLCNETAYQPAEASVDCLPCEGIIPRSVAPGRGSLSGGACQCRAGQYLLREAPNETGACAPCPVGLTCPGGLDSEGNCCEPPTQNANIHAGKPSFPHGPVPFMILCASPKHCPAGRALGECPPHAQSRACDICEVGWVYSRKTGGCSSCEEQKSFVPLLLTILAIVVMAFVLVLYAVREASVQSQTLLTVGITFTLTTSCLQVLSAFSGLSLEWPEPMQSVHFILQVLALRVELLNPTCVFGTNAPQWVYLGTLLMHPGFAVALGLIFIIARRLPVPLRRVAPMSQVANVQGLALLIMYVSISLVAVLPWQCERNPDGTFSIVTYRTVQCWRGAHQTMLAFSSVAIIIYDVAFIVLVAWATYAYPIMTIRPGGASFLRGFHFLFNRFKPQCYYYGLFYCMRNLAVGLIPVVFVNEVVAQLMLMGLTILLTVAVQSWVQPWRSNIANYLDALAWMALMLILLGGTMLLQADFDSRRSSLQGFFSAALYSVAACFVLTLCGCVVLIVRPFKPYGVFLSHHKVGAAVLARWFKIVLSPLTNDQIFYDSDNLRDLDLLFQVCAYESKNVVVLLTRETLRRIWCAGEITSAHEHNVNVVLVSCNDFELPTDSFIDNLASEWPDAQWARVEQLGIHLEQIQRCYRSLQNRPVITLDRKVSVSQHSKIVYEVFHRCNSLRKTMRARIGDHVSRPSITAQPEFSEIIRPLVLLGCAKEPEERLVAAVIAVMLQEVMGATVELVEDPDRLVAPDTGYVLVLLARGILEDARVGAALARQPEMASIPVHFDAAFTFPTSEYFAEIVAGKVIQPDDPGLQGVPLDNVAAAYRRMFGVLSLRFSPHASDALQRAEISEMVPRLSKMVLPANSIKVEQSDPTAATPSKLARAMREIKSTGSSGKPTPSRGMSGASVGGGSTLPWDNPLEVYDI